jgi:probable rRNA maturation factor
VLTELPFAIPPYSSSIPGIGGDDAINIRPEIAGSGALAQRMFVHCPSLRVFARESVATACRGLYTASQGRVFQVAGSSVWEILSNQTRVLRGTIGSSSGPVGISDNGDDMVILDGVSGYCFTFVDATFQEITDPEFPSGAVHLAYIDGYFLCLNRTYREKDYPTNVLSFPLSENSGELVLCETVMKKEYRSFSMSYTRFVTYLLIHGMLHLKGYDHGSTMEHEEEKFLKKFSL